MAIGFGKTSTRKEEIIHSLEQSYLVDPEYLEQQRREWDADYGQRTFQEFTKDSLFEPKDYFYCGSECMNDIVWNPDSATYSTRKYQRIEAKISSGFWGLQVMQDKRGISCKHYQEWDFTITVWAGDRYVFHPREARNNILRYHGNAVFEEWRKAVLADLKNFADVIKAYNPPASMFSATCCPSSERVCRHLGIPVRKGFAFLTHRKGEPCEHKSGLFKSSTK